MFRSLVSKLIYSSLNTKLAIQNTNGLLLKPLSAINNNNSLFGVNTFSTTSKTNGLMEFFDNKKNWTEAKVKHGREWQVDELRLKSNVDLHKLWFVLLKERNMLLTMEEVCKKEFEPFPSPERIAKVDLSMENILHVVEERNIAVNLLETGESKAYMTYNRYNSFGYIQKYRPREYLVPWYLNKQWKLRYHHKRLPFWSTWFRAQLRAKKDKWLKKTEKKINARMRIIKEEHPEFSDDQYNQYLRDYLEKRYNYKKPLGYEETIRKPRPDEIPAKHQEQQNRAQNLEDKLL